MGEHLGSFAEHLQWLEELCHKVVTLFLFGTLQRWGVLKIFWNISEKYLLTECFSAEECKKECQIKGYKIGDDASEHSFEGNDEFYSPGCFVFVSGKYEQHCFYGLEDAKGHHILSYWNADRRFVCTSTLECLDPEHKMLNRYCNNFV